MQSLSDYQYDLPPALIARHPPVSRTDSRLLIAQDPVPVHAHFHQLASYLQPNDLLVINDTRVLRARLKARKLTGGAVELLFTRLLSPYVILAQSRASKSIRVNSQLALPGEILVTVTANEAGLLTLVFPDDVSPLAIFEQYGVMPLPPYLQRAAENQDDLRYQTVYAKEAGAVAAPTAGLHFDESLMADLRARGHDFVSVTLHVGMGTFSPIRAESLDDHNMHKEYVTVSPDAVMAIHKAKQAGRRVVAVGTTVVRALESAAQSGRLMAFEGATDLFIRPGFSFQVVDALITNFHLPGSTLLCLVSAFAGYHRVRDLYQTAISEQYRFYSYGDAMLLTRTEVADGC